MAGTTLDRNYFYCPGVRCVSSTTASNDIFSKAAWPRALIFGMQHCLVGLDQVYSNGYPGFRNGPAAGGFGFRNEIYLKCLFSRRAWLRCL